MFSDFFFVCDNPNRHMDYSVLFVFLFQSLNVFLTFVFHFVSYIYFFIAPSG